jgi:heme/copper-type cytochrome/quinol oxidase subunit 4
LVIALSLVESPMTHNRKEVMSVIVSLSLVVILGVLACLLFWYARVPAWHALIFVLFGFYLASSAIGPWIGHNVAALLHVMTGK